MTPPVDARRRALADWLADAAGLTDARLEVASGDASFRRYFRVHAGPRSFIAMDAPPDKENSEPFVRVAGWLGAMGLRVPEVIEQDLKLGFLLLTDLGDAQYLDALTDEARATPLYRAALAALDRMQVAGARYQAELPPYDRALLERELALFRDWLCGTHLALAWSPGDERAWADCREFLIEASFAQPRVFVHRDYHSRNLMQQPDGAAGILDFQDAVEGPLTYDLVSLLKDCYVRWPAAYVRELALEFYKLARVRIPADIDRDSFLRAFTLTGVQRHLKAAGIFARLKHRDGKHGYMADVPRTLHYVVDAAAEVDELGWLGELVRERCLPALERAA